MSAAQNALLEFHTRNSLRNIRNARVSKRNARRNQVLKAATSNPLHPPLPRVFFCERLQSSAVPDMIPVYQTSDATRFIRLCHAFTRGTAVHNIALCRPMRRHGKGVESRTSLAAAVCP